MQEPMGASPEARGAGMTQTELECWVGQLGSHAMEVLAQPDGCPPTALVVLRGVPIATEVVLANDEDRALLRAYFEMAARGGAEACALVAEAWTARISTAARSLATQPGLKSLAEVPGHREVLFAHAVSPQGAAIRVFRIVRRRKQVALVADPELPTDDLLVSRFLTGLPWAPLISRGRKGLKARRAGNQAP